MAMGILVCAMVLAAGFYFFLFANPLRLHQANLLKWIPIALCFSALFTAGWINRETPIKYLALLFLPFVIFDLFNYIYFPFIIILAVTGILALLLSRKKVSSNWKLVSVVGCLGIFVYHLLAQPLIIEQEGFARNAEGELINATVLWNPSGDGLKTIPSHIVSDRQHRDYNLNRITGKTHFIAFWATWCGPCLEEKPQLDSLKKAYRSEEEVAFVDLSIDESRKKWMDFIEEHDPEGLQLITNDVNKTRRTLNISSLPLHFVVNPEGKFKAFSSLKQAEKALKSSRELNQIDD